MDPFVGGDVFDNAFSALLSPMGIVGAVIGLFAALSTLASRACRWIMLTIAIWVSTFAMGANDPLATTHLLGPLETIRQNGRLIATGALLCLLFPSLLAGRGWRMRMISGAAVAYLALELVFSGRILLAGMTTRSLTSVGIYLLIFIVFARGLGAWLQDLGEALAAVRVVAISGIVFVVFNAVQLVINPSVAVVNTRFFGTAGNPQFMAVDIASFLPAVLFLMLRKEEKKLFRVCLAGTLGFMLIMVAMTASRTGALMTVVVLIVMFRRWLGKFLKAAVVGCAVGFLALMLFPDLPIQTDRFTSGMDTRSGTWNALINDFTTHPLIGYVVDEPGIRESSYLSVAARLGIVGIIPLVIMVVLSLRALRQLRKVRPLLGEYAMLADTITAGLVSMAVGAATEGFLLGTLTLAVFLIYIYLSLITFVVDLAAQDAGEEYAHEQYYESAPEEVSFGAFDI